MAMFNAECIPFWFVGHIFQEGGLKKKSFVNDTNSSNELLCRKCQNGESTLLDCRTPSGVVNPQTVCNLHGNPTTSPKYLLAQATVEDPLLRTEGAMSVALTTGVVPSQLEIFTRGQKQATCCGQHKGEPVQSLSLLW
jgi:hypothetical protein